MPFYTLGFTDNFVASIFSVFRENATQLTGWINNLLRIKSICFESYNFLRRNRVKDQIKRVTEAPEAEMRSYAN